MVRSSRELLMRAHDHLQSISQGPIKTLTASSTRSAPDLSLSASMMLPSKGFTLKEAIDSHKHFSMKIISKLGRYLGIGFPDF